MKDKEKIKLLEKQIELLEKVNEINNKLIVELQRAAFPVFPVYPIYPAYPPWPEFVPDYYTTGKPLPVYPVITW